MGDFILFITSAWFVGSLGGCINWEACMGACIEGIAEMFCSFC